MKMITLIAVLASMTSMVSAKEMRAGGTNVQVLACKAVKSAPKNLSVSLELTRAAVNPQFNIKGATLVKKTFDPANGNPEKRSVLAQKDQTAYNASFGGKDVSVEIEKSPLHATVTLGFAEYSCK